MFYTTTEEYETDAKSTGKHTSNFDSQVRTRYTPKKIYVQMDNCSTENKNKFLLGYRKFLVSRSVFKTVEVSFLLV